MRTVKVGSGFQRDDRNNLVTGKDGNPVPSKVKEMVPLRLQVKYLQFNPGEIAGFPVLDSHGVRVADEMVKRGYAVHVDEPEAKKPVPEKLRGNKVMAGTKRKKRDL